jgi:hypothetical protein
MIEDIGIIFQQRNLGVITETFAGILIRIAKWSVFNYLFVRHGWSSPS